MTKQIASIKFKWTDEHGSQQTVHFEIGEPEFDVATGEFRCTVRQVSKIDSKEYTFTDESSFMSLRWAVLIADTLISRFARKYGDLFLALPDGRWQEEPYPVELFQKEPADIDGAT